MHRQLSGRRFLCTAVKRAPNGLIKVGSGGAQSLSVSNEEDAAIRQLLSKQAARS